MMSSNDFGSRVIISLIFPSSFFFFSVIPDSVNYMAYFEVHSRAVLSCLALSVLRSWAISGTNGSSGLGSVKRLQMESKTLLIVKAGLHWSFRISKQIPPFELMLQW